MKHIFEYLFSKKSDLDKIKTLPKTLPEWIIIEPAEEDIKTLEIKKAHSSMWGSLREVPVWDSNSGRDVVYYTYVNIWQHPINILKDLKDPDTKIFIYNNPTRWKLERDLLNGMKNTFKEYYTIREAKAILSNKK